MDLTNAQICLTFVGFDVRITISGEIISGVKERLFICLPIRKNETSILLICYIKTKITA